MCQQIIDELDAIARDRPITLDCEVDGAGLWDEHRVLQAISNLAANAVQHGRPGSPVRLRLTGNEERVAVEVHSEGAISAEFVPHLFEPFRSGRSEGQRSEGLGLGLFIAKAIAVAHGGDVEADFAHDATTFRLVLPRRAALPAIETRHRDPARHALQRPAP
jgi:signal transduction histidine kinase